MGLILLRFNIKLWFSVLLFLIFFILLLSLTRFEVRAVSLVSDNFNDSQIKNSLWKELIQGTGPSLSEQLGKLYILLPSDSINDDSVGIYRAGYISRCKLTGNFDIQVDYQLNLWPNNNAIRVGLITLDDENSWDNDSIMRVSFGIPADFPIYPDEGYLSKVNASQFDFKEANDNQGKLRLTKVGSEVTTYYYQDDIWYPVDSMQVSYDSIYFGIFAWTDASLTVNNQNVEVSFDNFVMNDGQLVCDNMLSVPFFSQKDPSWFLETYNHSSFTIEEKGCALSSSAMLLRFHGYDKSLEGEETNPSVLNEYLKTHNGYNEEASVIWSTVIQYAEDAKAAGQVPSDLPSLVFNYPVYDLEGFKHDIDNGYPGILKIRMNEDASHFVLGKGYDGDVIFINDPWDLEDVNSSLNDSFSGKTVIQNARFTLPTDDPDQSYYWLYTYGDSINLLVEHNGQKSGVDFNGQVFNEIPNAQYLNGDLLSSPDNGGTGNDEGSAVKVFMLPQPESGLYKLTLSGDEPTADLEMHIFNPNSKHFFQKESYTLPIDEKQTEILLNYNSEADENFVSLSTTPREVSFKSMQADILGFYKSGNITGKYVSRTLVRLLWTARWFYPRFPRWTMFYLKQLERFINFYHPKFIDDTAYNYLIEDLEILRGSIK